MLPRQRINSFIDGYGAAHCMTQERLAYRADESRHAAAPQCPQCGKPMIKRMARKGINSGREFWSCSAYPQCNGTREMV
ncbi:MAG: topoisomerase DNA-binding C4 zinc finger domain-containing protein [Prevotella sp.]|nr:topoisomerase DNA-binding C4 zinc finger domain-containing protein [Prevotella sp.]